MWKILAGLFAFGVIFAPVSEATQQDFLTDIWHGGLLVDRDIALDEGYAVCTEIHGGTPMTPVISSLATMHNWSLDQAKGFVELAYTDLCLPGTGAW